MPESTWQSLTNHYAAILLPEEWSITVLADPFVAGESFITRGRATIDLINRNARIEYDVACTPDPVAVIHELLHPLLGKLDDLLSSVCRHFVSPEMATKFVSEQWDQAKEEFVEHLARRLAAALPREGMTAQRIDTEETS